MADGYAGRRVGSSVHHLPAQRAALTYLQLSALISTDWSSQSGDRRARALPATAADDVQRAYCRALTERRPVVLCSRSTSRRSRRKPPTAPAGPGLTLPRQRATLADFPVPSDRLIGAGRLGLTQLANLERLGALIGALLATSAPATGLFTGLPYALGISGGFATPLAARLMPQADVVLVVGASLNQWTTKHELIGPEAKVAQIDIEASAISRHRRPSDRCSPASGRRDRQSKPGVRLTPHRLRGAPRTRTLYPCRRPV